MLRWQNFQMQTQEQIDAWYDKKRQALFDKYYGGIVDSKKHVEDKAFQEASSKLRKEYEARFDKFRKETENSQKIKKKIAPAINFVGKIKDLWHKLVELYK